MTPTLSRQFPLRRLAVFRLVPFWTQALAVCALFAIVGVAALDDYGVSGDEVTYRETAIAIADYIAIGEISGLSQQKDFAYRYYGVAFDMPLLLVERALGLQDTRHIYLTRHLIMHLFFIAGGFACGMIAYRTLGSRWVALLAMLMFLLHPRLYAHSFFNVKDVPFAVMLLIALYLARRAFRKDTLGAFLLCGIVVGLAIDLRPFGLMLLPMILAMRALDLWQAGREERKRILATGAAFLAAALATAYIVHPYYWENPLRFIEGVRALSQQPNTFPNLFMGEIHNSDAVPWSYIPVWFAITAPPSALALGVLGAAAVCWQGATSPLAALRDREIRFRILLLGCVALPVAVAIILQSNTHNDWRHMYFMWGPFCLLATVGLHKVANSNIGKGRWKVGEWLPGWVRDGASRRAFAYGFVGAGLITTLTAMAALHPYQQAYFNALVDTKTPGALANWYDMDYYGLARLQALEYLLARYPDDDALRVYSASHSTQMLPQNDRRRIVVSSQSNADFYLYTAYHRRGNALEQPYLHTIEAYGSVIAYILAPNSAAYRDYYRAEYGDASANGTLLARADFDIYAHNDALHYLKEDCGTLPEDAGFRVFLHIFPAAAADLPAHRRELGFESLRFRFADDFEFFDDKCIHRQPLPDYPIARIRTGRDVAGETIWLADIDMAARAAAQATYEGITAGYYGAPVAQSRFALYLSGNSLAYLKENCATGDADARFFLHIFPADPADLSADGSEFGFENLDFQFADHGAYAGDKCVAERELPGYAIERIRTGQFVSGVGQLWSAEFPARR